MKAKRMHLELKIRNMSWLMDKNSQIAIENKITIYLLTYLRTELMPY
jgi:hypothetical protein